MSSLAGLPVDQSNVNNLKDILMTYNKITEACFVRCAANFNSRDLTSDEETCISRCSSKLINSNQRLMGGFMETQTKRQEAMVEEMEAKAKEEEQLATNNPVDGTTSTESVEGQSDAKDTLLKGMDMLLSAGKQQQETNSEHTTTNNNPPSVDQSETVQQIIQSDQPEQSKAGS